VKAAVFKGPRRIEVENVDKPQIQKPADAIVRVTAASICGSDLHIYHGLNGAAENLIVGHEFMGIVDELGEPSDGIQIGEKVFVDAGVSCLACDSCKNGFATMCPNGGIFGVASAFWTLNGGQAEYVRVPYAQRHMHRIPQGISDEDALLLTDNAVTAYCAVEWGEVRPGDIVAVYGCGPVGLLTIAMAKLFRPAKIYAIDTVDYRLEAARRLGCLTLNPSQEDPAQRIWTDTMMAGANVVIETSGARAALENAFIAVGLNGRLSVISVFEEEATIPMSKLSVFGVTMRSGLTDSQARPKLIRLIQAGELDLKFVFTHTMPLVETGRAYEMLDRKEDGVVKIILKP